VVTKQRLSAPERRTQTLELVTRAFAAKGFVGTTSADLASAAGVSQAMLYKLFGSKRALYQAMVEHKLAHAGWGDFPVDGDASEEEFFRRMAEAIFSKVEADPDFVRLLLYSDLQGSEFAELFHAALGGAVVGAVGDYLRQRVAAGHVRELNPDVTGVAFLCMTWQYAVGTKVFCQGRLPQAPDEEVIETLVSLFLKGVQK
jgi:AcrR family transcriptional regulator